MHILKMVIFAWHSGYMVPADHSRGWLLSQPQFPPGHPKSCGNQYLTHWFLTKHLCASLRWVPFMKLCGSTGLLPSILGLSILSASQSLTHYHPQHLCSPISYTLTSFLSVCPAPTHPLRSNKSPKSSKRSPPQWNFRGLFSGALIWHWMVIYLESLLHFIWVCMFRGCDPRSWTGLRSHCQNSCLSGRWQWKNSPLEQLEQERATVNFKEWSGSLLCTLPDRCSWDFPQSVGVTCFHREVLMHGRNWASFQPQLGWFEKHGVESNLSFSKSESISHILEGEYAVTVQRLSYYLTLIKIHLWESLYQFILTAARNKSCD